MNERRFNLTEEYDGNFSMPIKDNQSISNKMFITEVVCELNDLHRDKEYWKMRYHTMVNENAMLRNEISIMREQGAKPSAAYEKYCEDIEKIMRGAFDE